MKKVIRMFDRKDIEDIFRNAGNTFDEELNSSIDSIMGIINQLQNDNLSMIKFFLYTLNSLNVGKIQLKTIVENYPYKNSIYSENYNEIINFIDSSLT